MYYNLNPGAAKDGEASNFNCETPVKRVSLQSQPPSKFLNEKLTTPRARCAIFLDETRALRYRKPCGKPRLDHYAAEPEVGVSPLSSGYQKPWPSRKVAGVEELVKYMSSVPCYLQRIEKGENVQEKALNFGVIDWRRLEKWTSMQKMELRNVVSSAMNREELLSSFANQTCSYSGRSSSDNLAQGKQTSSIDGHRDHSADENSRCLPPISTSSLVGRSPRNNHEKCHKSKHEYRTSMQAEAGTSTGEEKPKNCEQQRSTDDVSFAYQRLERNFLEVGDHLQENGSGKSKTLSAMDGDKKTMEVCNSSSIRLPQKISHQSSVTYQVPHSGLCSAMVQSDMSNLGTAAFPMMNEIASSKFMMKTVNQKVEGITGGRKEPFPKHPSDASLKWLNGISRLKNASLSHQPKDTSSSYNTDDKGKSNSRGRQSPLRRILDPLLKPKSDCNSKPTASSPIHRAQEHHSTSSLLTRNGCTSMNAHRSSDASDGSSTSQVPINPQGLLHYESYGVPMMQALVKLSWKNGQPLFMFSANNNSVLVASMRRTSKMGKDDFGSVYTIVTAQESKKKGGIWIGQSRNKKSNLLYDVIGRIEVSCSKLSCLDSKNLVVSKEFVLSVDKLLQSEGCVSSTHSSELAAIVVKSPGQKLNGSFYDALCRDPECENLGLDGCSSLRVESLQIEKYPEDSSACSIVAILPSGIHGFPETGNPTSIIERWKSGGSCDCGGWDEGCKLTVLADRLDEMKVTDLVHENPTLDEIHRIELFIQGAKEENKHAFSMIAFKEGLYTVQFGSSLTSLQAFAICIATLHSRNSIGAMNYSAKHSLASDLVIRADKSLQDHLFDKYPRMNSIQSDGSPTSYVPHHPPISPVGRA